MNSNGQKIATLTFFIAKWAKFILLNPQAVGMDLGVQFNLSNFLEDILQPTSFKMAPTSNLGL